MELSRAVKERRWRELSDLSDRQRALLAVAEKLSAEPTRMLRQDWEPLRKVGFDDKGCLEVAHLIGIFNYLTRLADGFGLELDTAAYKASTTGEMLRHTS